MIFDIHTNNIIHVTVTPEELRQDGHNIDWTNDSSIFTTDGIELDKTYYFSYHIHPILSESAYPKTLDFSFTGYELNDKLRDYFEVLNEATLLRDSSNLMVDIAIRSEQFFMIYATLKIMGNKMSVRKKLSKMHGANLVNYVAQYVKGRANKRCQHVMESAIGAYLWFKAPKLTKNNAVVIKQRQESERVVDSAIRRLDTPDLKAMLDDFGGDKMQMRKNLLAIYILVKEHYLAPEDVKLAA